MCVSVGVCGRRVCEVGCVEGVCVEVFGRGVCEGGCVSVLERVGLCKGCV